MSETSVPGRAVAAAGAIGIALTLALQLDLAIGRVGALGMPPVAGVWIFFCFFTIWTHILVVAVLLLAAWRPAGRRGLARPGWKFALLVALTLGGGVYGLLLRDFYGSTGWQLVCDAILHYLTPPLFLLYWLAVTPKDDLHWRAALTWLAYPITYVVVMMAQAELTGFYPYPFFDVGRIGYLGMLANALALLLVALALGLVFVAIGRAQTRR